MKTKFVHVNIVAHDWKKLADFYIKVFGCRPKPPERDLRGRWLDELTALNGAHITGMHLYLPGFTHEGPTLEVFQYDEVNGNSKQINSPGFAHIAFAVDDVDKALALLTANGGSAVGEAVNTEIEGLGKINVVYAKDPEGNIIELQKVGESKTDDFPLKSWDKIRYCDTDRQGHVNNALFSTFLETGRTEMLLNQNAPLNRPGASFVIAKQELDLIGEINWPGTIEIGTRVERIGNSSITLNQTLLQNEKLCARAETVIVQMDNESRKSTPLSADARDKLAEYRQRS